jgi:uncharacterized protein (DUF885 family)
VNTIRCLVPSFTLVCGSVLAAPAAPDDARTDTQRLDRDVDAYFEHVLEMSPTFASYIGDYRFNDQYENNLSREWIDAAVKLERESLDRVVAGVNPQQLDERARLTFDIFKYGRERNLAGAVFPGELLPLDQFSNQAADFAVMGAGAGAHPFAKTEDYETFLKRIDGFIVWSDQAISNMRAGLKAGVVQPRVVVQKLLPQLQALIVTDPEKSEFYQPLRNFPEGVSVADRERLTQAYRSAIMDRLMPAYRRLADFVQKEYLPASRSSVSWSALPNGAAWYAYFVERYTTTHMKPDEIHRLGLAEVARIEGEMNKVREQVGFQGDLRAFFRHLKEDPRYFFASEQEVLDAYRALKLRIDALLPKMFDTFPRAGYEVRAVEPFRAAGSAGAFYEAPSADGSRPGVFYVNTFDLRNQPKYGMETLSLHEAAPGHHFQVAIQQELTDLPRFRRFENYTAYAEGWALYCESIGKELGLFTDPYQYYGRLNDEMLRAMRLVVDTGLHSKGWTREQAIGYMTGHSSMGETDAVSEVERYIVIPGQALGYKIGQLRITALRARAEQELGPRFDVKEFHREILRDGAVPMDVLEMKIDRWIAARKAS